MNTPPLNMDRLQPWLQKTGVWAPGIAVVVLVLLLARVAGELTWEVLGGQSYTSDSVAMPAARPGSEPRPQDNGVASVDAIMERNLFGVAEADDAPLEQEVIDAPETRLNLNLKGIYATGVREASRAIIAEGNNDEKIYAVGDRIPGNATIENIYMDRVIIRRGGNLEALRLPRSDEINGSPRAPVARRPTTDGPDLIALREELLDNPERITDLVRFRPVYRNAEFQGYRIYPGQEQEIFRELGLRPGDLVKEINGVRLDDPQGVMELINELPNATSVSVMLERRGETENLSVSLDR